jgi:hypothetical protein
MYSILATPVLFSYHFRSFSLLYTNPAVTDWNFEHGTTIAKDCSFAFSVDLTSPYHQVKKLNAHFSLLE